MRNALGVGLLLLVASAVAIPAFALESFKIRESVEGHEGPADAPYSCPLTASRNGSCSGSSPNYRWYNACNGYIWIFNGWMQGEGVGVRFGGPGSNQPCVAPSNRVKRGIYYFRNICPFYNQTVDVYLDADCNNDGCPEANLSAALNVDPGLRWNCINYGICIPCNGVILRQVREGGAYPTFATDGPFKSGCDPLHPATHSYYYGVNGNNCVPWVGVSVTTPDDFLMWIVIDNGSGCPVVATEKTSWGAVKGFFR